MKKKLNLKLVPAKTVMEKWQLKTGDFLPKAGDFCLLRCNKKGEVNWDKASAYDLTELVGRNITIH